MLPRLRPWSQAAILIIRCTGALARNHRGAQRRLRRTAHGESRAVNRLFQPCSTWALMHSAGSSAVVSATSKTFSAS